VSEAELPPHVPTLTPGGRWPACCLPPTAHPRAFPRVASVGFACQHVMSHSESLPQGVCGLCPDLRSSRICSGWVQDVGRGERPPHLLLYAGGFSQVGHDTYQHTSESQAISWSTHPKTSSWNLKGFPTFMGEACLPFIPRAGRRFQAANIRANFVLLPWYCPRHDENHIC